MAAVARREAMPLLRAGRPAPSLTTRLVAAWLLTFVLALLVSGGMAFDALRTGWMRSVPAPPPPVAVLPLFMDLTPVVVPTTADWRKVPQAVTHDDLLRNPGLWRRMHLEDWDAVGEPLRQHGLDAMLARHAWLLADPQVWDAMDASDWDLVPQPIRGLAYRHMVEYWSGVYRLGEAHGLPRGLVTDTAVAIVMTESWFEHRAIHENSRANRDLGLGQASDFARRAMRTLWAAGAIDVLLDDVDHFDPWKSARFVVVWFGLALDDAGGDLGLAVRAYHRGIGAARAGGGADYLDEVRRRLRRYLRDEDTPPSWRHLVARDRELTRVDRPWMAETPEALTPP